MMFSISELALASCKAKEGIRIAGFGRLAARPLSSTRWRWALAAALRTTGDSTIEAGGSCGTWQRAFSRRTAHVRFSRTF
jgi:hypothetical protein